MMTRMLVPLSVSDISSFAKKLKSFLDVRADQGLSPPSHLELLNLLARATGTRSFQTFRALAQGQPSGADAEGAQAPEVALEASTLAAESTEAFVDCNVLSPTVRKALKQFDTAGRLVRLPNKLSVQQMAMWWMWTHFAVRRKYTEKEVNQVLNAHHTFGDQATLRRELVSMKLLGRKSDCSEYWKEPMRPSTEVQDFLRALRQTISGAQPRRTLKALTTRHRQREVSHATT